jgi:DNA-binding NarL/FixJ family response regulator
MQLKNPIMTPKTRVFLVDDHPIVLKGFRMLFGLEPDMAICGEADSVNTALEKMLTLRPDVAVVDLSLKDSNGLELIKQLRQLAPTIRLLVFTMRDEAIYVERTLGAGAHGYITKEEGPEKVIEAVRALMQGKRYFSTALAEKLVDRMTGQGPEAEEGVDALSDRQLEVLELIGNGLGSRAIAQKLGLSVKTIAAHREHIKLRLGLASASELAAYAFTWVRDKQS